MFTWLYDGANRSRTGSLIKSRGLSEHDAKAFLIFGFAKDIAEDISNDDIKKKVTQHIIAKPEHLFRTMFDEILNYRKDFPILDETKSNSVIYLDNTATTQKPKQVIQAMTAFLNNENATVHRGIYGLSQEATIRCDQIREDIKTFINAASVNEVIFTKGATESINLVATSYVEAFLQEGDEIIITQMEHHANIVPWQLVCEK